MKKWMKKRRCDSLLCLILVLIMTFLSGCGEKNQDASASSITLLEPVSAAASYEEVACRNLYKVKVYSSFVFPEVQEYSFSEGVKFSEYAAYPGETVKKGTILAYSDTTGLEKQIEDMEEAIAKMEEEFNEYKKTTQEAINKPKGEIANLKSIVEAYIKAEPSAESPDHQQWEREYLGFEGQYRILAHSTDTLQVQLEQKTQLYELDHARNVELLTAMKKQLKKGSISADFKGEVMAIAQIGAGSGVQAEAPVIAVGDRDKKILKCQYINQSVITKAQEVYALINGVRYEVTYQAVETEVYNELKAQGETIYTSFILEGAGQEVQTGDFAVIVVTEKRCEEALSVAKEALHKDESGYYVYILNGSESIYTPVKIGMSDGVYTQILSGLELKDKVILGEVSGHGQKRAKVEMGSFYSEFKGTGYMMYPSTTIVKNPVEYGTTYYIETKVALYQQVKAGDVLAEVRVQSDENALQKQKRKLERMEERLRDLEKEKDQDNSKQIEQKKKDIEEVKELIASMENDKLVTKIKAKKSGIVINIYRHVTEDILAPGEAIMEIADENICYIVLENTNQQLNYGNTAVISYKDMAGNDKKTEGLVSNLSEMGVSNNLSMEYSMLLLPSNVVSEMAVTTQGREGWWSRNSFAVSARVRNMDNVLVVPKKAVKEINGSTYVYVVEEDGTVTARSFVSGGYNDTSYWVVEGLKEGMEICLE